MNPQLPRYKTRMRRIDIPAREGVHEIIVEVESSNVRVDFFGRRMFFQPGFGDEPILELLVVERFEVGNKKERKARIHVVQDDQECPGQTMRRYIGTARVGDDDFHLFHCERLGL